MSAHRRPSSERLGWRGSPAGPIVPATLHRRSRRPPPHRASRAVRSGHRVRLPAIPPAGYLKRDINSDSSDARESGDIDGDSGGEFGHLDRGLGSPANEAADATED